MKFKLTFLLLLLTNLAFAQDSLFARKMLDTLTSRYFWGRGYTNDGAGKAARFLTAQFQSYGLKPMDGKNFVQPFNYPVNTFPGKMEVAINDIALVPGRDFIVSPDSRGVKGGGKLVQQDSIHFMDKANRLIIEFQDKLTWSAEQTVLDYPL